MKLNWIKHLILMLCLIAFGNAQSDTLHPLNEIEQVAYEYALSAAQTRYDSPRVVMGKLDPRLRLQECEQSLNVFDSDNRTIGNKTIGVTCDLPTAWTVYIPVEIKVFKSVVVAKKTIAANKIISKEDLQSSQMDISSLRHGYTQNIHELIGQQLKYSVAIGSVIKPTHVRPQKIVKRGEYITLVAKTGSMEVKMNGTALSDASVGQRIRVKNNSSKRIVEGIVDSPGVVKVML